MTDVFDTLGTIGIEEEFYVVDSETLLPVDASDDMLDDPPGHLDDHIGTELFKFVMEVMSEKCWSLKEARSEIYEKRNELKSYSRSYGYEVLGAGLHPAAEWMEYNHIEKPRYVDQLERLQYPQQRNITCGLHVHVGMDDAEKAVWVCDEIRRYLPLFLALSSNSPFWCGFDTGLKSGRALVFENLPNTGMPSRWGSWSNYRKFEERMVEEGFVEDPGELWWDVRPNTTHGTVEVRSPDSQVDAESTYAFVVLIYRIAMQLADMYERGVEETGMQREALDQNKWRALRYGYGASFFDPEYGVVDVDEFLDEAIEFGGLTGEEVVLVGDCFGGVSDAELQIKAYESDGLKEACEVLRL
ncbi:MAG: glutamate--cysteine ligase [Halobacteria archaeon]